MGDEYVERKIRVYEPKVHKGESKFTKYALNPVKKLVGIKPKNDRSPNERRLTA